MEILVRFITCCGINMWIYLRIYLSSETPNEKKRKKYERFCSILVSSSILWILHVKVGAQKVVISLVVAISVH